jgi:hypothetical protein
MNIIRNSDRERFLFDTMRPSFGEREGIHLSDLLTPKQAYWKKVMPLPVTDKEIQYFVIGRGHEDATHRITGYEHLPSRQWQGIWYSMDFFDGHPIEHKTRRGYLAKEGEEAKRYDSYLNQVKGYCACEDATTAELWIWSLLEKVDEYRSEPVLACYDVHFTQQELQEERERLLQTRNDLAYAISTHNPLPLPDCPEWMCAEKRTNMIKKPFCVTCLKEFETQWGIEKHTSSNTGRGHEVMNAEYEITYTARCKWFQFCKPITPSGDE